MTMLSVLAIALFLAAAITDVAWRKIPNELVFALAAVGLGRLALDLVGAAPLSWISAAAAVGDAATAAAILVAGAFLFNMNWIGGGDVKLLAAGALWLGVEALPAFLLVTALAGGLLACFYLAAAAFGGARQTSLPYGVAIAAAGVSASLAHL